MGHGELANLQSQDVSKLGKEGVLARRWYDDSFTFCQFFLCGNHTMERCCWVWSNGTHYIIFFAFARKELSIPSGSALLIGFIVCI